VAAASVRSWSSRRTPGRSPYRETIILAPGEGLDAKPHDLVVVDATGDA
jgi:hypothetical protein